MDANSTSAAEVDMSASGSEPKTEPEPAKIKKESEPDQATAEKATKKRRRRKRGVTWSKLGSSKVARRAKRLSFTKTQAAPNVEAAAATDPAEPAVVLRVGRTALSYAEANGETAEERAARLMAEQVEKARQRRQTKRTGRPKKRLSKDSRRECEEWLAADMDQDRRWCYEGEMPEQRKARLRRLCHKRHRIRKKLGLVKQGQVSSEASAASRSSPASNGCRSGATTAQKPPGTVLYSNDPVDPEIALLETSDETFVPVQVIIQTCDDFDDMLEIEENA